ncbi:MAG: sugar ABC transporter substrate-binding protein [bacterium]|nr:sugar ABC transporter substrate-binding protein [bacterium]
MKRFVNNSGLLLCAALLFFFFAPLAQAADYRIAFVARSQADSFAAWFVHAMTEEVVNYRNLHLDVMDSQADDAMENAFIESALANRYDLIIVQPNSEAQRPCIEKAISAGVPVIITNPRITGIEGASTVDADAYEQAAVSARLALTQMHQDARAVVLNGPSGNGHAMKRRQAWQKEFFNKRPDVQIVAEGVADWRKDEAARLMQDWVQTNDKIDLLVCMNDSMCLGALEVLQSNPEYADIHSYGVDGIVEAVLLIQEGRMTATALQNAYELAARTIEVADGLLSGTITQIDIDLESPLITKENVGDFIEIYKKAGAIK